MGKEAKDIVRVTDEERHTLQPWVAGPRVARAKALRARLRLQADVDGPHGPDRQLADAFAVGLSTRPRLRQRGVEDGLAAALTRQSPGRTKPRPRDGAQEARLVALACSQAPEGRVSWTLRLLAAKLVARELVETSCREPVRPTLHHTLASPGGKRRGASRPRRTPRSSARWKTSWRSSSARLTPSARSAVSRQGPRRWCRTFVRRFRRFPAVGSAATTRPNALGPGICSGCLRPWRASGRCW